MVKNFLFTNERYSFLSGVFRIRYNFGTNPDPDPDPDIFSVAFKILITF
jgi:hypothetical protein